ncbi:MAG: periplasmic heavy metal sensor [Planctomycetes bacterium]|nr:periplasmic heavy metal sensor [Planctomycetota bacterium]
MIWRVVLFVLVLSLAVNVPFVAMWARHSLEPAADRSAAAMDDLERSETGHAERAGNPGPPSPETILREIGVDDAQWEKMRARHEQFLDAMGETHQAFHRLNVELLDLIAAAETDAAAISAKQEEILGLHKRMQELILENLLADKQALTAEQRTRLFDRLRQLFAVPGSGGGDD